MLSRRLDNLVQSDIRTMTRRCEAMQGINLGQGLCDVPTPGVVLQGATQAIEGHRNSYCYPEGTAELRRAIAKKLEQDNGIQADPASEIVVTVGSTGAYVNAIMALLNPGDGVLLFEPFYGYHLNAAVVAGLEVHYVALKAPDFSLDEKDLEEAIQPNTRAIVLCSPANPSGKMFRRAEIERVAKVAKEHDLLVITDEIYEYFRYGEREHLSPATIGDLWERTVTIMGLSKTFSVTGWRLGYAVAPRRWLRP